MHAKKGPQAVARFPNTPEGTATYCKSIRDNVKNSTLLPSQPPTFAAFSADVDAFDAAVTKAKSRNPADIADRNAKGLKVEQQVGHIVDFTQGVADQQATPADAVAVIRSTGLDVRKSNPRKREPLVAKYTGISGEVLLLALVIAGAGAYFWEYSVDSQKSWLSAPETRRGRTTITGLTPGQVVYFRFRALTDDGKGDYSQVVSLLVH